MLDLDTGSDFDLTLDHPTSRLALMRDATAAGLVQHLDWAADKGLMPRGTAKARRVAVVQVLEVQGDLASVDLKQLDLELAFDQFVNLRGHDFTPGSLQTYRSRLKAAVVSYLSYVDDPSSWRPPTRSKRSSGASSSSKRSIPADAGPTGGSEREPAEGEDPSTMAITFPLARGRKAVLRLPGDLDDADVRRLTALLTTLPLDEGEE